MSEDEASRASATTPARSAPGAEHTLRGNATELTTSARSARVDVIVAAGLDAELAAAECFELGAGGLEEAAEAPGSVRLRVWIDAERADALASALRARLAPGARVEAPVPEPEVDWSLRWRDGLGPIVISERLVVRPPFAPFEAAPGQAVVVIEPGQAFGTGGHASTRLALAHVAALAPALGAVLPGAGSAQEGVDGGRDAGDVASAHATPRVLDVGTGSGVLALAALALAPPGCVAIGFDLDPLAAPATRTNAEINRLASAWRCFTGPISALAPGARFDLVLANLLKRELLPIVADLAAHLAAQGTLVVSGLLARDLPDVESALAAHGLVRTSCRDEDDLDGETWSSPCFTRR